MTAQSIALSILVSASPLTAGGWDRQKAFDYLEARQQQWAAWKPAQKSGGPCVSCHTGLPYLMALRASGETQRTATITGLVNGVRSRLLSDPPARMLNDPGVEAILNALTLSLQRRATHSATDEVDRLALQRLWQNQLSGGEAKGSWTWFKLDMHPVESDHSNFFGAALAQLALSSYPSESGSGAGALRLYLQGQAPTQPLHNRLAWIAFDPTAVAKSTVLRDLWAAQSADGGWTSASLGPWAPHENAPPDNGSNAYATAWAAFTAHSSGVACNNPGLKRALAWLQRNQDASTGAWRAVSMNKQYPPDSMQSGFMTDAATGYAAAALTACKVSTRSK